MLIFLGGGGGGGGSSTFNVILLVTVEKTFTVIITISEKVFAKKSITPVHNIYKICEFRKYLV